MVEFLEDVAGSGYYEELKNAALNFTLDDVNQDLLFCHGMITGFLVYCSLLLHIFVLAMLAVERKLLDRGDVFLFALFTSNLLKVLLHSSTIPIVAITKTWLFGDVTCRITGLSQLILVDVRQNSLTALAIYRFCNVIFPYEFRRHRNKVVTVMFAAIGLITISTSIMAVFLSVAFVDISWPTCDTTVLNVLMEIYDVYTALRAISILTGIVPFILYIIMWKKAQKIRSHTTIHRQLDPPSVTLRRNKTITYKIRSYLNRKFNKEKKAFTRLIIMLFAGLIFSVISNSKKFSGGVTYGLTNNTAILLIHFMHTWICLTIPYLDMLMLLSTEDKVKTRKSFLKKLRSWLGLNNNRQAELNIQQA